MFIVVDTAFKMVLMEDRRKTAGSLVWSTDRRNAKLYDTRIGAEHVIREWTRTWNAPIPERYAIVGVL